MKYFLLLLATISINGVADTLQIPETEIKIEGEGVVPILTWDCYKELNTFQNSAIKSDEKYNSENPEHQIQISQFDTNCGQMTYRFRNEGNGNFRLEATEISKINWWGVRRFIRASIKFAEVNKYGDIIDTFGSNLRNRVGIFSHNTSSFEDTESIFPVDDIPLIIYATKSEEDGSMLIESKYRQ